MALNYAEVLNAFLPAKEIEDPARFAGRRAEVERAVTGVLTDGAHLFVYGPRGIGKSSFARQIQKIAQGDLTLLRLLGLDGLVENPLDFLCISVRCDDSVLDLRHLLSRTLSSAAGLAPWLQGEQLEAVKAIVKRPAASAAELIEAFGNAVREVQQLARDGIIWMIDEFDRVRDRRGLASILKALADTKLKALIVGVSDDLDELVTDHKSLLRQMAEGSIKLPPMPESEALEIIEKATQTIRGEMHFTPAAAKQISSLSHGQPYLVHVFGKWSLVAAYNAKLPEVSLQHLDAALQEIATKKREPELEARYRTAVASSPLRESVLRAFASIDREKIHTSEAYARCPDVGKDKAAVYVGHLRQEKYGAELIDRGNRYHEFRDALFKTYVNATPRRFLVEESTGDDDEDDVS